MESAYNIALVYTHAERFRKASQFYQQSLSEAVNLKDKDFQSRLYLALSDCYFKLKKYEDAYESFKKYIGILNLNQKISVLNSKYKKVQTEKIATEKKALASEKKVKILARDTARKSKEIQTLFVDNEEKKNQIELQTQTIQLQDRVLAEQKKRFIMIIVFSIIVTLFSILFFRLYLQIRRAHGVLQEQKKEIEQQHKVIATKNREITDSIHYAKRIQSAMLPQAEQTSKLAAEHFVFLEPRDIVSGDFYWMAEKCDKLIVIASDCTGHGVPGAFMSLLGVTLLNEIIFNKGIIEPAEILNHLRAEIIRLLHQNIETNSTRDGMDISVVTIDRQQKTIKTAAAYNSIYIVRNNELIIIPADKMPVAMYYNMNPFNSSVMKLQKNDIIYLASDGFKDQFGGPEGKKYTSKNFKNMLIEISRYPIHEQKVMVEKLLNEWRRHYEQNDDILVIGLLLS